MLWRSKYMRFERQLKQFGSQSIGLLIPPDIVKYFNFDKDIDVVIEIKEGKYGKYLAIWRKDETKSGNTNDELFN